MRLIPVNPGVTPHDKPDSRLDTIAHDEYRITTMLIHYVHEQVADGVSRIALEIALENVQKHLRLMGVLGYVKTEG